MSKKEHYLIALVLVMAGLYLVFFSGCFTRKSIAIDHSARASRAGWGKRGPAASSQPGTTISFSLHRNYRLTAVEVVPAAEFQTNKHVHRLWHMVSARGSAPVDGFAYGFSIPGMAPSFKGAEPESLVPGVQYRLLIQTSNLKGEHDFSLPGLEVTQP